MNEDKKLSKKQQEIAEIKDALNRYPCVPGRIKKDNEEDLIIYPFIDWIDENGNPRHDFCVQKGTTPNWCIEFAKWKSEPKMNEFRRKYEEALAELLDGQQILD